jgi:hypothetical protein
MISPLMEGSTLPFIMTMPLSFSFQFTFSFSLAKLLLGVVVIGFGVIITLGSISPLAMET